MVIIRDMSAPLYANVDAMHYTVQAEQREAKRHAIKVEARQPSILEAAQVNLFIVLSINDTLTPIETLLSCLDLQTRRHGVLHRVPNRQNLPSNPHWRRRE